LLRISPLLELLFCFGALRMFHVNHSAKIPICVIAAMTALSAGSSALAAPGDDLGAIRDAISNLRQEYEAKVKDLEDRLQKAEGEAEAAKAAAASAEAAAQDAQKNVAVAQPAAPEPPIQRTPTSNNAFNPGIAAVLNGFSSRHRMILPLLAYPALRLATRRKARCADSRSENRRSTSPPISIRSFSAG
jgi:hypothetical protein